jgi:hypothetical protein
VNTNASSQVVDSPYTPPKSLQISAEDEAKSPDLYVVSLKKFTILYLATLGVYKIYWLYKNWSLFREATGERLWPVARAIFSIFYIHALFRAVTRRLGDANPSVNWNPQWQATLLVLLIAIASVGDRLAAKSIGSPFTDLISILLLVPICLLMRKAQKMINLACRDEAGAGNDKLSAANYAWIALGACFWTLLIIGLLIIFGLVKG